MDSYSMKSGGNVDGVSLKDISVDEMPVETNGDSLEASTIRKLVPGSETKRDQSSDSGDIPPRHSCRRRTKHSGDRPKDSSPARSRRISLPNDCSRTVALQDTEIDLKGTSSTPYAFAPLCVIAKSQLRHLHSCTSHSNFPHLYERGRRRLSCPNPFIKPVYISNQESTGQVKKRRQSFPSSKNEVKERSGCPLHRCKGHTTASLTSVAITPSKARQETLGRSNSDPFIANPSSSIPNNRISKSIHFLDTWSTHVLESNGMKNSFSALRREDSRVSFASSLGNIHEEDRKI